VARIRDSDIHLAVLRNSQTRRLRLANVFEWFVWQPTNEVVPIVPVNLYLWAEGWMTRQQEIDWADQVILKLAVRIVPVWQRLAAITKRTRRLMGLSGGPCSSNRLTSAVGYSTPVDGPWKPTASGRLRVLTSIAAAVGG